MLAAELPVSVETQSVDDDLHPQTHPTSDQPVTPQNRMKPASTPTELPADNQPQIPHQVLGQTVHGSSKPAMTHSLQNQGVPNSHIRRDSEPVLESFTRDETTYGGMAGTAGLRQRKSGGTRTHNHPHQQPLPHPTPNTKLPRRRSSSAHTSASSEPYSTGDTSLDSTTNPRADSHIPPFAYSSTVTKPIPPPIPTSNCNTIYGTAAPSPSGRSEFSSPSLASSSAAAVSPPKAAAQQQQHDFPLVFIWPIIFAVTPPIMTLLFGSGILWGEMFLLLLAAFYLYFITKMPWDMYHSVRPRRSLNRVATTSHLHHTMSSDGQTTIDFETMSQTYRHAAQKKLKRLEHFYLGLIALSPFVGGLGLYLTRCLLTQPNQLISNFNIVLFIVAAGIRPLNLIMNLGKADATRLQDEVNYPSTEVDNLKGRVAYLEGRLATVLGTCASKADFDALKEEQVSYMSTLSRTVRKAEKRVEQIRVFIEERIPNVEGRLRQVCEGIEKCRGGELVLAGQQSPATDTNVEINPPTTSNLMTISTVASHHPHHAAPNGHFNSSSRSSSSAGFMSWSAALLVLTTWLISMVGYVVARCALLPFTVMGGVICGIYRLLPAMTKQSSNQTALKDKMPSSKYHINGGESSRKRGSIQLENMEVGRKKHSLRS
ncbi:hypothetical protein SeMB42_g06796 [Synchytrium endobioticum]|uniref:Uncharacterized protein n=1 Tax=Synchytrium endobioticum TaxID=286115 RepID=A0A507CUZ0_9FUNG|nr:hypothetical protein SeMB42_g06796 [Synchytrium endobioticum]TPX42987.1 hypothetical protein SeLEV6574_g05310 [Synchytrium endobioticum]